MKIKDKLILLLLLPFTFSNSAAVSPYKDMNEDYRDITILNVKESDNNFSGSAKIKNTGSYFIDSSFSLLELYNDVDELMNTVVLDEFIAPYQTKTLDVYFENERTIAIDDIAYIRTVAVSYAEDDYDDYSIEDIDIVIEKTNIDSVELDVTIPTLSSKKNTSIKYVTLDISIDGENYILASDEIDKNENNINSPFELEASISDATKITVNDFKVYLTYSHTVIRNFATDVIYAIPYFLIYLFIALIPISVILIILLIILIINAKKKKNKKAKNGEKLDTSFDETSIKDDNNLDNVEFDKDNNEIKYTR